ncbi:oxygen-independent coproporphyrinogen III oxidase [Actibacterium ureilyticum]|uniref:oxygen-independent coproporphyrinogen III oxidase n=1 Tax=Actibacterium ureilyticum TaxID=1590614 RepID=UPI000BAB1EB2|nr:oxygen-independent coproporphyrinogen III oxidase [Actibacterium ureilyticum]
MKTESQLQRLGLFDARVPRYTSYPTAPHFNGAVGAEQMRSWIGAIRPGDTISLYLHVPFCRRLCWFCACRTQGTRTDKPLRAYVDTLKAELALLARDLPDGVRLSRLHWGGGTPTLLHPEMISELCAAVFDTVPLDKDAEFSVEIDPNEVDAPRVEALAQAGMNRASIGVQDFNEDIQSTIGRIQSYETTRDAVELVRAHGVGSVNADILFGLPGQTTARIADSVQKLLSLSPDRVALYGYAHVPWMAKRQQMIPSDALPTPQERLKLFETARRLFLWDQYSEIGIDHFARIGDGLEIAQRTGRLRRNFQGYTDDTSQVLIGLGASSISKFPQGYAQNAPSTSDYTRAVQAGGYATARGHVFSADDTLRARLIEALMCDFRIDRAEILSQHDIAPDALNALFQSVAEPFGDMVKVTDTGFRITPEGRPLTRIIARGFDAYDLSKAGHSSAI